MAKRGNPFFGDSGTVLNGPAREQIEQDLKDNSSHGDAVDYTRQTADGPEDEDMRQAKETIKVLHTVTPDFWRLHDPDELAKLTEELRQAAEEERTGGRKQRPEQEPEESPSLSREADDKFWNDPEELKRAGRSVRPPRL